MFLVQWLPPASVVQNPLEDDCLSTTTSGVYPIHILDSPGGFIANSVTESTGCGSLTYPWAIEAGQGQRIHLTLFDFNVASVRPVSYLQPRCPLYAVVKERLKSAETRKFEVCGGLAREKSVYTSQTNRLEIGIAKTDDPITGPFFLFKYEGRTLYNICKQQIHCALLLSK